MTRALVFGALAAASCGGGAGSEALVEVKRADLVIGVELSGELAAVDSTEIKPPPLPGVFSFKVASLAEEGADVKEGDPVFSLDPSELVRELETRKNEADAASKKLVKKRDDAALARREEQLAIAEAEAAVRKATLKTTGAADLVAGNDQRIVQLDLELAELQRDQARAKAAKASRADAAEIQKLSDHLAYLNERVAALMANLPRLEVKAPRAGTLVMPTNWRGEKKKVGDGVWVLEAVVEIVALDKMYGKGELDEIDMARVAVGQPVALRIDAFPDAQVRGRVEKIATSVAPKSEADPSNVVKVRIAIDGAGDVALRPGMRFRGEVETERLAGVVQVPPDAVFVTPEGPVAYRADGDRLVRVPIQTGKRNQAAIEVRSGLAPGDRVSRHDPERSSP